MNLSSNFLLDAFLPFLYFEQGIFCGNQFVLIALLVPQMDNLFLLASCHTLPFDFFFFLWNLWVHPCFNHSFPVLVSNLIILLSHLSVISLNFSGRSLFLFFSLMMCIGEVVSISEKRGTTTFGCGTYNNGSEAETECCN